MRASRWLPLVLALVDIAAPLGAQPSRIAGPIDGARTVSLRGNIRPMLLRKIDGGRVDPDFALSAMTLLLEGSPSQQAELRQLLAEQQNPRSSLYHHWLTPEDFADRFGVSAPDSAALADWLRSQGFRVSRIARSRTWIAFSGTAGHVRNAFHTEIHSYARGDKTHFANAAEPSIPQALAGIVAGIAGLDDFGDDQTEMTSPSGFNTLAPDDIATIYDIAPLYQSGVDGTGMKIAVAGNTEFNASALADLAAFRSKYNLLPNVPRVIANPDYPSPGVSPGINEAHLDIEWAGAVARNAQILFVYSQTFLLAVEYAVDNNLAPVITMSANIGCEAANAPVMMSFYQGLAQQANAQGITWVNSGGDAGAAAWDGNGASAADNGLGIRFPASIPEVTAVGGTEFNEQSGNYWNSSNNANGASALSYLPEMVWNDSAPLGALWAGGGGASIYFQKPEWQSGPGVPDDGVRDTPDVAMAASFFHDGYNVIRNGVTTVTGGTSAAAPVFAGILVLLNQYLVGKGIQTQPGLGNVNPTLYALAAAGGGAFHDITVGNNIVPCDTGTLNCTNGTLGFNAGPGYDLASGLGSVDAAVLAKLWSSAIPASSQVLVTANPNPVTSQLADSGGQSWTTAITVGDLSGAGTRLTGFTVNGMAMNLASSFKTVTIPPRGSAQAILQYTNLTVPLLMTFGVTGVDASGFAWSRQLPVPFYGSSENYTIGGVANAASYQQTFAPGMLLYVPGTGFSWVVQTAGAVPLATSMGGVWATINGTPAPLYYVSPLQLDVQIPYEVQPGSATLAVNSLSEQETLTFTVAAAAPGIFTTGDGSLVPFASALRGETLPMFITGQGAVSPVVATGAAPQAGTPASQLPKPVLPVKLTIGGIEVTPVFVGIPEALAGVTQINFQVPANTPLGPQKVIVTIGGVSSAPATLNVTE